MSSSSISCNELYAIHRWGEGYVEVNDQGHLCVRPDPAHPTQIDLVALTEHLRAEGLSLPVLVRFDDLLRHRVRHLQTAFATAINQHAYQGTYRPVYPIKVNQQRSVVRAILSAGGIGLEAGSKPELLAVLALAPAGETVVCNGYKDREYIRLALIGQQLGLRVLIVIEKPSELALVVEEATRLDVTPMLGIRVRLASAAAGKWQNSGGEKAKFGLSAHQILTLMEQLRATDQLGWLRLLHAHLGSQIPSLRDIRAGVTELGRFYVELRALGAPLEILDLGGGLGVDYEGTRTRAYCSVNYSLADYAESIVATLARLCHDSQVPAPDLITESGRALSAHHAVLITDVIDREQAPGGDCPPHLALDHDDPDLEALAETLNRVAIDPPEECLARAGEYRASVRERFVQGGLTLAAHARADALYAALCRALRPRLSHSNRRQREWLDRINTDLADKLFCNFSVFQSLPDVWAIDQIFPIVPLQRLHEPPTGRAIIHDLTCDSDGCIRYYVDQDGIEASVSLHDFDPQQESYLLGFFMVGAYQEILGDIHNLFGDTDAVNVCLDAQAANGYRLLEPERGDATEELLRSVHFEPRALLAGYRRLLQNSPLDRTTREQFFLELKAGLYGYTYLSDGA